MCGRYQINLTVGDLRNYFGVTASPQPQVRYNVAPGTPCLIIRDIADHGRIASPAHWGLIPFWARDPAISSQLVNARGETAADKPAFRAPMRYRRCLIPATAFYEWKRLSTRLKHPYCLHRADRQPLAIAGLWDHWENPQSGERIESFTLLTTAANADVAPIHHRMPLILEPSDFDRWLDPTTNDQPGAIARMAADLIDPAPDGTLTSYPVSQQVNSPRNDGPEVANRVRYPEQPELF